MNNKAAIVRAITGPILLITLGSLFAIDYFNEFRFGRTWPVLLIVFGLMKLLERGVAGNEGQAFGSHPPQGGGS
jgi:hypothetical protein